MYKVYAGDICIYDDKSALDTVKLVSPKLTLSDNAAGSFSFTMPPTNVGYSSLIKMVTPIIIFKEGVKDPFWEGRVLTESIDFWKSKKITCEGILAALNDTIQPQNEYINEQPRTLIKKLLDIHNSKVDTFKRFELGLVSVDDPDSEGIYRYTDYETTMSAINEKFIKRLGGHLRIRWDGGVRKLDYIKDYPRSSEQTIYFGKNLSDFTQDSNMETFATVVIPRGAQKESEAGISGVTPYVTVADLSTATRYHEPNSMYVYDRTGPSPRPIDSYGRIETVVDFGDINDPVALLRKAEEYLRDIQFDKVTLSLTAVDLHYLDVNSDDIRLLDRVRVYSLPHGMNRYFPVTKLEIPLDKPEDTKFTFGSETKASLSSKTVAQDAEAKILADKGRDFTNLAAKHASEMLKLATNGHISVISNQYGAQELIISESDNYLTPGARCWRFNLNGLGHFPDGYSPDAIANLALTMDGKIVADAIQTGILQDQMNGRKFWLNLNTGELRIGELDPDDPNTYAYSADQKAKEYADAAQQAANTASETAITEALNSYNTEITERLQDYFTSDQAETEFAKIYNSVLPNYDQKFVDANSVIQSLAATVAAQQILNQQIQNRMTFTGTDGLTIHQGTSSINLSGNTQTFYINGNIPVLTLNANGLTGNDVHANSLTFGNWRWTTESDGRLSLVHV